MIITIYNKNTGEITKSTYCDEDYIVFQYDSVTEDYIEGTYKHGEYYVEDGQAVSIPTNPGPNYTFNYTTKQWEDLRTLQEVKDVQWEKVKASREAELTSPLLTPFGTFDATISAQKSITDAILLLQTLAAIGNPQNIDFTLADNTTVTLTTPEMVQVGLILGARTQELYSKARPLRAQIDAATTISEVEAIIWS